MITGGKTINGKRFVETNACGAMRYTRRVFIDGKMVTRAKWLEEMEKAKAAERAAQK